MAVEVRPAIDDDSAAVIELIAGCFAEYPGCVLDLPGIDAWMLAPAASYDAPGAALWVAAVEGAVVACVGVKPAGPGEVELKSLYVAAPARRQGLGGRLIALVESAAADQGAGRVALWTDTRFTDAHRLYERHGYRRGPRTRELHDPSRTTEYHYTKSLVGPGVGVPG